MKFGPFLLKPAMPGMFKKKKRKKKIRKREVKKS